MKNEIGARIRLYRQSKNLSQENMANELNLSIAAYSNIERGVTDVNYTRILELSKIFNIKPEDLLNDDLYIGSALMLAGERTEEYKVKSLQPDVLIKLKELQKTNEELQKEVNYLQKIIQLLESQDKNK